MSKRTQKPESDLEAPTFGPAWLGKPRAVPDLPKGVETAGDAVRWVHGRIQSASDAETEAAVAEIRRRDDEQLTAALAVTAGRCTTCGNPVAPGATCAVDGQIAPRG